MKQKNLAFLVLVGLLSAGRAGAQNTTLTGGWLSVGGTPTNGTAPPSPGVGDAIVQRALLVGATGFPSNLGSLNAGDTFIMGNTWLNKALVFRDNATAAHRWVIDAGNADAALRISPVWDWSKGFVCLPSGDVNFLRKVSVGNVASPGSLGINNLTMAVGGSPGARAVYVVAPTVPWPDYVFDPEYRLRPLADVAQFVQANCHLPDVPAAATVQVKGLNLGEMDALLLKKVEELTLYLLELKAANEALQGRVNQLEHPKTTRP